MLLLSCVACCCLPFFLLAALAITPARPAFADIAVVRLLLGVVDVALGAEVLHIDSTSSRAISTTRHPSTKPPNAPSLFLSHHQRRSSQVLQMRWFMVLRR